MPVNYTGYWAMISNDNFEAYLKALGINIALRKIACLVKVDKEIMHEQEHMVIRTLSSLHNYVMDFVIGQEFEEDLHGVDGRKCMTTVAYHGDKLVCIQRGEKENRGWTHWIEGDKLYLSAHSLWGIFTGDAVCGS
uniref:Retinol binding protein 1, cellular, tandem duplicate 2 n=1 Tax=Eptatretus burgeri TaxID=7764 RepID=A0A8C4R3K2_EPTBU